jgi:hypothetical protein
MVHNLRRTIMSDEYYDISVSACGFLNRVRVVEPKDGRPYRVCTFVALRGAKGERAEPTYFDAKIVGDHTVALIAQYEGFINDKARTVFASVRLSDIVVKPFVRQKGERKGETGFALKTRLLAIESLAVDGVVVYRRAEDQTVGRARPRDGRDPKPSESPSGDGTVATKRSSGAEQHAAVPVRARTTLRP